MRAAIWLGTMCFLSNRHCSATPPSFGSEVASALPDAAGSICMRTTGPPANAGNMARPQGRARLSGPCLMEGCP
jgi:hypothetical protein